MRLKKEREHFYICFRTPKHSPMSFAFLARVMESKGTLRVAGREIIPSVILNVLEALCVSSTFSGEKYF